MADGALEWGNPGERRVDGQGRQQEGVRAEVEISFGCAKLDELHIADCLGTVCPMPGKNSSTSPGGIWKNRCYYDDMAVFADYLLHDQQLPEVVCEVVEAVPT